MRAEVKEAYTKFMKENWQKQITMTDLFDAGFEAAKQINRDKITKLISLLILTDPIVSNMAMSELQIKQYNEFIKCFPDEGKEIERI